MFLTLITQNSYAVDISKLNPIEVLTVKSKYFKTPLTYNVTLPKSYYEESGKDKKYFVVFDIHPRSQPYLSGLHDWLSHNGDWPWIESIIITPTGYNAEFAKLYDKIVTKPSDHTMLNYFEANLLTAIDKKYRTNGFRIYSGFMSNGALGLYVLLNRPNLFNAYIITSPSLANDFAAITSDAEKKLAQLDDKMRFLYLATGNHQYEKGNIPSFDLFEKALKTSAPKSLDWQAHHNHQNSYMSQPIISVINGIEALFDDIHNDLKADSDISKKGVQAIIDYYANITSKKYGFEVSAEGSLKALAKSLLVSAPEKALAIYQKTVNLYPNSAYAWSALAKVYAESGNISKAIELQTTAVEKSKTLIEWHQKKHKQYLKEYKNLLK
jgi:hypothetical protein